MFEELNHRLEEVRDRQRLKQKWERKLDHFTKLKDEALEKASHLKEQLEREKVEVTKLEGMSLSAIMLTIIGAKEEKLSKEKQEVYTAKLKYDEALEEVKNLEEEQVACVEYLNELGDPAASYEKLLNEKAALILDKSSPLSEEVVDAYNRETEQNEVLKEMNEAIGAGKEVMVPLQSALEKLEKAKGWGTFDLLGGGPISSLVKHGYFDDAKANIHQAQHKLKNFHSELSDIGSKLVLVNISERLTFADVLFDGIIVDWMVQDKISKSLQEVENQLDEVRTIISRLESEKMLAREHLDEVSQKRITLVNKAK